MTSKELRKLSRKELIELFLAHAIEAEKTKTDLTHDLEQTRKELTYELELTRQELELTKRTVEQLNTEIGMYKEYARRSGTGIPAEAEIPEEAKTSEEPKTSNITRILEELKLSKKMDADSTSQKEAGEPREEAGEPHEETKNQETVEEI